MDPQDPTFARLRAAGYQLLLTQWERVAKAAETVTVPDWLTARVRELWLPLLIVAALAEREGATVREPLLALAREHLADRATLSEEGEAVIADLEERLGAAERVIVRPRHGGPAANPSALGASADPRRSANG